MGTRNSELTSPRRPHISLHPVVCCFVECGLSASSSPKSESSTASRRRQRAESASAARRQRLPGVDRSSAASDRRQDVGSVDRALTALTERPLNSDRAPTKRRPSAPVTRGLLWRRLVFGVCVSLRGLHSNARVLACSCCASPNNIPVLSLAGLSALFTSGVSHYASLGGLSGPGVRGNTSGASGCIGGLQARALVSVPPDALPIATLHCDCPMRPLQSPSSSSAREARVADLVRAPSAWSALYGPLPKR